MSGRIEWVDANMLKLRKILSVVFLACVVMRAGAVDFGATASVNITSDTAATAKNMALSEARRQIISDALRQYVDVEQMNQVLTDASDADLMNLIASTGIDDEKISDTTYSANISMTLSPDAVRRWLAENSVQNWLPDGRGGDRFIALITTTDAVADWMEINTIARNEQIDLATKYIMGNQITVELPSSVRAAFTIALREGGWHYAASDGVLRIWK